MQILKGDLGAKMVLSSAAPSCFIEGTWIQYAWDSTSLEGLKKCPRYYQYVMIENWQSLSDNIHLRWGGEFHSTLEGYERAKAEGYSHDDALRLTLEALLWRIADWTPSPREVRSEKLKTKENLVKAIVWYLDHYEDDNAKTVMLENGKPAVELSFHFSPWPTEPYWNRYLLCGHLDKIVDYSGDLYVMDHKTTTNTPTGHYFNGFDPHNQMSVYTIASQTIMKSPIKGVIVDAIQVADSFTRPVRGITYRSSQRLDEWLEDLKHWLRAAEGYATEGYWPQNDTACSMYGGCRFRDVCSKSPQVREAYLKSKFTQEGERWNPLKPR